MNRNPKKESLLVLFTCERCGARSVQPTPPLSEKRSGQLLSGAKANVLAKARLCCKCPECGSKQSWSSLDFRFAKWSVVVLALLWAAVYLLLQQDKISFSLWRALLHMQPIITAALLLSAALLIARYALGIYRMKKNASIAPVFGRTMEEIKERTDETTDCPSVERKKEE